MTPYGRPFFHPDQYNRLMLWSWLGEGPEGGPCRTVEIQDGKLIWDLEADHDFRIPADHAEQSFEDFRTYGPAWTSAPADVITQLVKQTGLENPPWLGQSGYDPFSRAWHAIERGDQTRALAALASEDPRRTFRHRTTLLMHAAAHGMPKVVERLLHSGAEVNARDERGQSALLINVRSQKQTLPLIQLLIEHGADQLDEALAASLYAATNLELVEYLLDRGARIDDSAALHAVARKGWTDVIRTLLARGLDPNCHNSSGGTPLMWASNAGIVELLLAAGADPNAKAPSGDTALSFACASGETWKVAALLKAGADPNVRGYHYTWKTRGQPVLQASMQLGRYPEIVELLRGAGATSELAY